MTVAEWIAIAIALIGVVGTLIACLFQLKRDGKTIDSISSTSSVIDKGTAVIKEKVDIVHQNVSSAVPHILEIANRNKKIDFIAEEIEYQKRVKQEFSENANGRDTIMAGISSVFEENARLNQLHHRDQEEIMSLKMENTKLRSQNQKMKEELQRNGKRFKERADLER